MPPWAIHKIHLNINIKLVITNIMQGHITIAKEGREVVHEVRTCTNISQNIHNNILQLLPHWQFFIPPKQNSVTPFTDFTYFTYVNLQSFHQISTHTINFYLLYCEKNQSFYPCTTFHNATEVLLLEMSWEHCSVASQWRKD